jgi:hypothetical protein
MQSVFADMAGIVAARRAFAAQSPAATRTVLPRELRSGPLAIRSPAAPQQSANAQPSYPVYSSIILGAIATPKWAFHPELRLWTLQETPRCRSVPSVIAVTLRFTAFAVQLIISVYWASKLLA